MQNIVVRIRNKDYKYIGEALNYTDLNATVRFNDVGDWTMSLPAAAPEVKLLNPESNPGGGIVIHRGDRQFFSGPIRRFDQEADTNTGYEVVTVGGGCDNLFLTWPRVFPDPENPNAVTPGADYYQVASTNTESIIRDLVAKNLAQTAPLAIRRLPGLSQDTNGNRGKVQPASQLRFDRLLDAVQKYALLAPDDSVIDAEGNVTNPGDPTKVLGFRIVQSGQALQFQVYPLAKRPHVRFSFDLANLASAKYAAQGGTANVAIIGYGGTTDANGKTIAANIKTFTRADPLFPGRIETYVDAGSLDAAANTDAVDQAGLKALDEGTGQVSATVVPIDTDRMVYGKDYDLGDYVSVELPNLKYSSPIRSVTLTNSASEGERVEVSIGTPEGQYTAKLTGTTAKVAKLSAFERFKSIFGG